MLVLHIRSQEGQADFVGFTRDQLADWYVKEMEDEINTKEELENQTKLCKLIISRLVETDKILVGREEKDLDSRLLTVHPNYNLEDASTQNLESPSEAETSQLETDLSESEVESVISASKSKKKRQTQAPTPATPATPATPTTPTPATPTTPSSTGSRARSSGRLRKK